jgi:hypothetical protein
VSSPEPITAPGIHDKPAQPVTPPFTQQQFFGIGQALLNGVAAFVLYALAGINVLGVNPFGFLRIWADDLAQRADDAYNGAVTAQATGENAQYSADTANAGVARLDAQLHSSGTSIVDTFNRAAASNLGGSYDRSMGSGSGAWGTDGTGAVHWTGGGSTSQVCIDRHTTPLLTVTAAPSEYQVAGTVLTSPPAAGQFGDNAEIRLTLRMNTAKTTYVVATINNGFVEIGYVISGTYTRIGATQSVSMANGDGWEFRAGTASDVYEFELLRNGVTVCTRFDSGAVSQKGAGYEYGGLIARAGTYVFFFATFQLEAPDVQILTLFDRIP